MRGIRRSIFPVTFTAGLTFKQEATQGKYAASDGWSLTAVLRGPQVIDLTATLDGNDYEFFVDATVTAQWAAGRYTYSIRATKGSEIYEVEAGAIDVLPNLNTQTPGYDGRTHAERTLEAIEAVIENRASIDQESYRINNRELYRTPVADLLKLRDVYRAEVQRERLRARGGAEFSRRVKVVL